MALTNWGSGAACELFKDAGPRCPSMFHRHIPDTLKAKYLGQTATGYLMVVLVVLVAPPCFNINTTTALTTSSLIKYRH